MATSKNTAPVLSAEDARFIGEQLGLELWYARRDATTVRIGNQAKSASKMRFDRDRYARMQVIASAFAYLTGIQPIERQQQDVASFMKRIGANLDLPEEPVQSHDNAPWDMNANF